MQRELQLLVFGRVRLRVEIGRAYPARLLTHQLYGSCCCHSYLFIQTSRIFSLERCTLTPAIVIARRVKCLPSPLPPFSGSLPLSNFRSGPGNRWGLTYRPGAQHAFQFRQRYIETLGGAIQQQVQAVSTVSAVQKFLHDQLGLMQRRHFDVVVTKNRSSTSSMAGVEEGLRLGPDRARSNRIGYARS